MKKIYLEGINSRISEVKGWIYELEDRGGENHSCRTKRKEWNADRLTDIRDKVTQYQCLRRRRKKEPENIWRIIVENFPNMGKKSVTKVQEAQRGSGRNNSSQVGKNEYQRNKGKPVIYEGIPICVSADFSV